MTTPTSSKPPPFFNAPAFVLILPVLIILVQAALSFLPDGTVDRIYWMGALIPERFFAAKGDAAAYDNALMAGLPFIGSALLHIGWTHTIVNAGMLLGAGGAVSRWTGARGAGVMAFAGIVAISALVSGLVHLFVFRPDGSPAVGASGIVSGLVGAALLMMIAMRSRTPRLRILTLPVLIIVLAFTAFNLFFAFAMGAISALGIAWQAHIGGFVGGIVALRLLAPTPVTGAPLARGRR